MFISFVCISFVCTRSSGKGAGAGEGAGEGEGSTRAREKGSRCGGD
jgi:hypothetical protein